MIGAGLMLLCVAAAAFLMVEAWRAWVWHHRGGERKAHAEYLRMRRERVDNAEARLTEAEFIRYRLDSRPGPTGYLVAALLLLLIGLPASCALLVGWP